MGNFEKKPWKKGLSSGPVEVLWQGMLPCSALGVKWKPDKAEKPSKLIRAERNFWNSLLQANPEKRLFNGALAALEEFFFDAGRLLLTLSATDYRAYLYAQNHRNSGENFAAQTLGISAVVRTNDGSVVLMKRSARVGEYPNRLDVFGGHIDPHVHRKNGKPDPCTAIGAELQEELGVTPGEIEGMKILGLIRNLEICWRQNVCSTQ